MGEARHGGLSLAREDYPLAKLVAISGETGWQDVTLAESTLIGRDSSCDVTIPSAWVSRQHSRITLTGGSYFIEDLGTINGTMVNGRRVERSLLSHGDKVTLGRSELTFLLDAGEVATKLDDAGATVITTLDVRVPGALGMAMPESAEVHKLRAHLKVLQEIAEATSGTLEIEQVMDRVLEQMLRVFPQADHAHAVLKNLGDAGKDLPFSVRRHQELGPPQGISATLLDMATRERRAVLAEDAMADPSFLDAASIAGQSLRSVMCSPLVTGESVLGAIQVDTLSSGRPFSEEDLQLLVTVTGQVAVAAENAVLHRELVAKARLAAIGEAISSVAHCIKNVLNGLKGGAYILDVGIKKRDADKTGKGWDMVKRNTDFMLDLVKDMLAYCRKAAPTREQTDVGELLKGTVLMVQESASRRGVTTSVRLDGQIPEVSIDPTGIKRAILNLVTNGVEACPRQGHVQVSAATDGPGTQLRISVEDDGPGMPEDVKEHLFEPFFTTKGSSGTGLGLALVRKVVEEHKGSVKVRSQLGHGTAFHISIPVAAE